MADTRLTELQEKQNINDTDLLYVVDPNEENIEDRSKKMQLGTMISKIKEVIREEVVLPEIQSNLEAIEQPDGINVKFTNPIPDWGNMISFGLEPSEGFFLPKDSLLYQYIENLEYSSSLLIDGA